MIAWRSPECAEVAPPAAAAALLEKAVAVAPRNPNLRIKLAGVRLDQYDFAGAASALEAALEIDPFAAGVGPRLARCYNGLGRYDETLEILGGSSAPDYERGFALAQLGRETEAELEYRAVLAADPGHRTACRRLCKMLRKTGRIEELLEVCENLAARGVRHGLLLYVWGTALALNGRDGEARALLLDPARVIEVALPVPPGFAEISQFNAVLADEILSNPHRLSEFPIEDEANRGSSRVHALLAGKRPHVVRLLLDSIQDVVAEHAPGRIPSLDLWADARPEAAHLKAWGLIQRGSDYEEWHLHPGGWLSGVYYVRVPSSVSGEGAGPGCIEFGPPTALARMRPDYLAPRRYVPREGMLLLAPSHYAHRTIPSGSDEYRISFAFDVVPEG